MDIEKILDFFRKNSSFALMLLLVLAVSVYKYGLREGLIGFAEWIISMCVIALIAWVIWRIFTGSWSLSEWTKKFQQQPPEESEKQQQEASVYIIKIVAIGMGALIAGIAILTTIFKLYIHHKTGSWWID
jgi:hypothetical protein